MKSTKKFLGRLTIQNAAPGVVGVDRRETKRSKLLE
jgi:hypothetical protein